MTKTKEIMNLDEFASLSKYRTLVYNLFSRVFARKPDRKFMESLMPMELIKIIGGLCENEDSANELQRIVKDILLNNDKFIQLSKEFEELFVVPVRDKFIPPYISYYMSDEPEKVRINATDDKVDGADKSKGGESAGLTLVDKLKSMYGTFNFTLKNSHEITLKRPDHISYVLGFMGALVNLEERYRSGQVENKLPFKEVMQNEYMFFYEFIENRIGMFASEAIDRAGSPFYVETARLMLSFTSSERRDYQSLLLRN